MERRRDVRVNLYHTVLVTPLGGNGQRMKGRTADLSGRGMRILVPAGIAVSHPVRIDLDDAMLLGEVCYCQPYDRGFMIGVELDQALNGMAQLARLRRALLPERDVREHDEAALSYSMSE